MILRRIVQHLKEQNWTAVAIELLILILGVFLGTQVSNWNQQRIIEQQADAFTARLRADLREEHWGYEFLINYNREVLANAERAVAALDSTAPLSDEALLVNAYRATQYKQPVRRRSTYDELISTGTIALVRDRSLRDTAMRLYTVATIDNLVREGAQSRYREAFRMRLPNSVQRTLSDRCGDHAVRPGDYESIKLVLDYPCSTGLPEAVISDSARALRSDASLAPLLRLRIADIDTRLVDLTRNNYLILDQLKAIAAEKP